MTRVTVAAALYAAKRVVPLMLAGLLAVLAAACSTQSQQTGVATSLTPGEQPVVSSASVAFAPLAAPGHVSTQLGKMLTSAAQEKQIRVVDADKADYTVKGYLVAAPDSKGTKVSYIWDVTDKSGKRARRFSGEKLIEKRANGDPWSAVGEAEMREIATATADTLAAWLPKKESSPSAVATTGSVRATSTSQEDKEEAKKPSGDTSLAAATAKPELIVVAVPDLSGAPGDGNTSLAAAMKRHLKARGVRLAEGKPADGTYTIRGTVELGEATEGQQPITIRWLVLDPKGKPLKNAVVQRNKIREGSLDGAWGNVADLAAAEAAKAVAKILNKPTS